MRRRVRRLLAADRCRLRAASSHRAGSRTTRPPSKPMRFVTRDGLRLPLRHWDADHPQGGDRRAARHERLFRSLRSCRARGGRARHHGLRLRPARLRRGARSRRCGRAAMRCAPISTMSSMRRARNIPACRSMRWAKAWAARWCCRRLQAIDPPHVDGVDSGRARRVVARGHAAVLSRGAVVRRIRCRGCMSRARGCNLAVATISRCCASCARDPLFQHSARADQVYGLVNLMDEARHAPEHLRAIRRRSCFSMARTIR